MYGFLNILGKPINIKLRWPTCDNILLVICIKPHDRIGLTIFLKTKNNS